MIPDTASCQVNRFCVGISSTFTLLYQESSTCSAASSQTGLPRTPNCYRGDMSWGLEGENWQFPATVIAIESVGPNPYTKSSRRIGKWAIADDLSRGCEDGFVNIHFHPSNGRLRESSRRLYV